VSTAPLWSAPAGVGAPAPSDRPVGRVLVVIPTFQEAGNIERVLWRVRSAVPDAMVLVVDDNSPDGTADLAEMTGAELGSVAVLRRSAKTGLGGAYRAGFAWGLEQGFDVLVEMDADLSHDPASLPALLSAVESGADLSIGSRYVPGGKIPRWSWHRRLLSRWGNRYAAMMLRMPVRDATAGFRAYRAHALRGIELDTVRADGYGFQIEMAYRVSRGGGRIVEVPISFADREVGESKMSSRIVVEALTMVTRWGLRDLFGGRNVGRRDRRHARNCARHPHCSRRCLP
jgi:dolichol-phosphate mannosyltransferase